MNKSKHFAAAALILGTVQAAEAAPEYRDIPLDLDDCAKIIVSEFAPAAATISSFKKTDRDVITHEFSAGIKHDGMEQSLTIVTYPKETGPGSIVITAREKNEIYNYLAVGVMDRGDLQANATMSIQSLGHEMPIAEAVVSGRVTSAISRINRCVTKFEDPDGRSFIDPGL